MRSTVLFMAMLLVLCVAYAADPGRTLPPTFLPGVLQYDAQGRYVGAAFGSTRFLTCKEALDDTQSAIAKANEVNPQGWLAIGTCLPIPTRNELDLISQ